MSRPSGAGPRAQRPSTARILAHFDASRRTPDVHRSQQSHNKPDHPRMPVFNSGDASSQTHRPNISRRITGVTAAGGLNKGSLSAPRADISSMLANDALFPEVPYKRVPLRQPRPNPNDAPVGSNHPLPQRDSQVEAKIAQMERAKTRAAIRSHVAEQEATLLVEQGKHSNPEVNTDYDTVPNNKARSRFAQGRIT